MKKRIYFEYGDNNSEVFTLLNSGTLEKTAGHSAELFDFISNLKGSPRKTYALVNALSAGEFFGSNRNGDYFPENALKEYHKTFEALAHIYRHHVNKDPQKSMGKVVFSFYNPAMRRVELVLEIDETKGSKLVEELGAGRLPAVSMGCRVPWDECSICGNRAKTRASYCTHLMNHMNKTLSNGQKVYAINRMPKFFDISVVTIPADRTAGFIKQISLKDALAESVIKTAEYPPPNGIQKTAGLEANAAMTKKVIGKIESLEKDPKNLIISAQKKLTDDQIEKLSGFPLNEVLSTFIGLRIMPVKEDFQKLALMCAGKKDLAESLEKEGTLFTIDSNTKPLLAEDINCSSYNEKIAGLLFENIPDMALTKELVIARGLTKLSQGNYPDSRVKAERSTISKFFLGKQEQPRLTAHQNPIKPMGILGGLYYGYAQIFNDPTASGFKSFMKKNPWLLPVLVGAGTAGSLFAQDRAFKKEAGVTGTERFLRNSLMTVPVSYYFSGTKEHKARQGQRLTSTEDFVRKHPVLVALGSSLALGSAQKGVGKTINKVKNLFKFSSVLSKMDYTDLDLIYNDLIN